MNGYLDEDDQNLTKEVILLQQATSCDVIGTDLALFSKQFKEDVFNRIDMHLRMLPAHPAPPWASRSTG